MGGGGEGFELVTSASLNVVHNRSNYLLGHFSIPNIDS
jgi:hypothetical protein